MKIILFLLIIFYNSFCFSQFLEYKLNDKTSSVELGMLNNFLKPGSEFDIFFTNPISFTYNVPFIAYRTQGLYLSLGGNQFKVSGKNISEVFLDGYYDSRFRLWGNFQSGGSIPVLMGIKYLKINQEFIPISTRFEVGDVGIGSGFHFNHDFDLFEFQFHYFFIFNYSIINFSVSYGYSIKNEIESLIKFNDIFDDFGILIGAKYTDSNWKMSDSKFNYFGSWFGAFIGITL